MREKGSVTQCVGKKRYATLEYANGIADKMAIKYGKPMRSYSCGICMGYHITSKPK